MSVQKFFPIKTETSCQLKWTWSTLSFHSGRTLSCCRSGESYFNLDSFENFHNTEVKIQDRKQMLLGQWPDMGGCDYCSKYEKEGGFSERNRHALIPNMSPPELNTDPNAVYVTPTALEIYFDNTCNLGCLYCVPEYSSVINQENKRHGVFESHGVKLEYSPPQPDQDKLLEKFWHWMEVNSQSLKRFSVLGGEPFYQRQFHQCIEYFESNPHPDLELSIVTNLMVDSDKLDQWIERFKKLLRARKLKRIDITCSIDCWGPEQEFVRWGLDLAVWEKNFEKLLKHKWLTINIMQTLSALTVKTMSTTVEKLNVWRTQHKIGHWFSIVNYPTWMDPSILGSAVIDKDIEAALKLMSVDVDNDAWQFVNSFAKTMSQSKQNKQELMKLNIFLDEKDRRRGTNWKKQFPWLEEELKNVVQ